MSSPRDAKGPTPWMPGPSSPEDQSGAFMNLCHCSTSARLPLSLFTMIRGANCLAVVYVELGAACCHVVDVVYFGGSVGAFGTTDLTDAFVSGEHVLAPCFVFGVVGVRSSRMRPADLVCWTVGAHAPDLAPIPATLAWCSGHDASPHGGYWLSMATSRRYVVPVSASLT